MIPNFIVREQYVGVGTQSEYTFDFTITNLNQILIRVTDALFNLQFYVRGTDVVNLSNVIFDPLNGGGSVFLAAPLPTGYLLTLLLANDVPTQTSMYRNKSSFNLRDFENSLDYLTSAVQRLQYLMKRAPQIGDDMQIANPLNPANPTNPYGPFNPQLPIISTNPGVQNNVGKAIVVGADNASWDLGPGGGGGGGFQPPSNLTEADFTGFAAPSGSVALFNLPPGAILTNVVIKTSVPFQGPGITDVVANIGPGAQLTEFIAGYDCSAPVSDQNFESAVTGFIGSFVTPTPIFIQLVASGGGNLSALTQGAVSVWYSYEVI